MPGSDNITAEHGAIQTLVGKIWVLEILRKNGTKVELS